MAFIFAFFTFVVGATAFYANKGQKEHVTGLCVITGLLAMIAWAIYVGEYGGPYGSGVAFEILTWLLAWICAGYVHTQT